VVGAGPVGLALALHAAASLDDAEVTLFDARQRDKDVSGDPRTLALSLGSVQLLQRLGAWRAESAQPILEVHVSQDAPSLVAYRTAQEALTNISKHAQATRVQIDLSLAGGVLSLEISDNGRGVSEDDLAKSRSFGIRGLHERATTVGGWIDLSSGPHGTTLILSVPLDTPESAYVPAPPDKSYDPSQWADV